LIIIHINTGFDPFSVKALYFVPALAVLGLSLSAHADGEQDTLQAWIDYVDEYRQYMEDYRQWASDRFGHYESQIRELTAQLDEKDKRIQEIEETIDQNNRHIRSLEDRIDEILKENEQPATISGGRDAEPPRDTRAGSGATKPGPLEKHSITADKETYVAGDTATITGKTDTTLGVTVILSNPDGRIVGANPVIQNGWGEFETTFKLRGSMFEYGTYTARIGVGDSEASTQFELIKETTRKKISVSVDGNWHDINYAVADVSVDSAEAHVDDNSMVLSVDAASDGILEITFKRDVFDAREDGTSGPDLPFVILANGEETEHTETKTTSTSRTLRIGLDEVVGELTIIGTALSE